MLGRIEGQSKLRVLENTNSEITVKDWLFSRTDCGKQEPMTNRNAESVSWPEATRLASRQASTFSCSWASKSWRGDCFCFTLPVWPNKSPEWKKKGAAEKDQRKEKREGCWSTNSYKRKETSLSLLGLWFCILIFFQINHFPISLHPPFVFTITSLNILLSEKANCKLSWH